MKKYASALAFAAVLAAPAASAEFTLGGDFDFRAFSVDTDVAGQDNKQGYDQRVRLSAHFKNEDGVQVNTRLRMDSNWSGDAHNATGTGPYTTHGGDVVSLDYGYAVLPLGGTWNLNVGRMTANWGFDFLTSDDRRDRILALGKVGNLTVGAGWDKRVEGNVGAGVGTDDDDGDMYQALVIGVNSGWLWGVAVAKFVGEEGQYALANVNLLNAMAKGKAGPVELTGSYTYVGGGDNYMEDNHHAAFLRAGYDFGAAKVEAQALMVLDGGLVAGGWDSFSASINNSPSNNVSRLTNGGYAVGTGWLFGGDDYDRTGFAARVIVPVGSNLKVVGAAGLYQYDAPVAAAEFDLTFVEAQLQYQMTKSTAVNLIVNQTMEDRDVGTESDILGMQLSLKTVF